MGPYIFGRRSTIHIIDIRESVKGLLRAKKFIAQVVSGGKGVLFVGTKRQARLHIRQQASRVGMPFVAERWLGGTLTNFRTIRSRLQRLEELEAAEADGSSLEYSKKMIASRTREARKIKRNLEGIRDMEKLPGAVIVIDVHRERNAVREARKLGIPTVCLIDTDSDPDFADIPIPGNDDAIRAIEVVLTHLADAVEEGKKGRTEPQSEQADALPKRRVRHRPVTARAEGSSPDASVPDPQEGPKGAQTDGGDSESPILSTPSTGTDTDLTPATAREPNVGT